MKKIFSLRRAHLLAKVCIFLITAALIAGMAGCDDYNRPSQNLEIRTWYDLDDVRDNLRRNYILMNNLDSTTAGYEELASPTANGGIGWQPIGSQDAPFTGTFDGQGYEIKDLFINRPSEDYVGLFGIAGGVITNIGVINVTVAGVAVAGGLVGINDGTVSNSYFSGNVTGDYYCVGGLVGENLGTVKNSYSTGNVTGDEYVGGLVGLNGRGTVRDSYSTGSVSGGSQVGGLVGRNSAGTVSNSYAAGSVSGASYVGGLVGFNGATVSNSYSTGDVTGSEAVGGLVGVNCVFLSGGGTVSNSYYNYDEVLINGENIITIGALFDEDFAQWIAQGKFLDVNERLSQQNGYYLINDVSDFKQLLAFGQVAGLKFRLANDLDLATEPNFYIPYFAGEFDGNGHKISNLKFDFAFVYQVGLFGYLAPGGGVHDVAADNINITGSRFVGGLVGCSRGTVSNSHTSGSVTGNTYVGGLVGWAEEGAVSDSYFTGSVSGGSFVGGLVGSNWDGAITDSYSSGSVTGNETVGGLVGQNHVGTMSNSYSTASVTGQYGVGGLVGFNIGSMIDVATVSECYSTGSVTGDDCVGGLVGANGDTVSNSYSTGSVTGNSSVGGLVGVNEDGTVSDSFWDIQTSGQYTSDGGTGKNTTEMQDIDTFTDTETEGLDTPWDITAVAPGSTNTTCIWNIVNAMTYPFLSWQP